MVLFCWEDNYGPGGKYGSLPLGWLQYQETGISSEPNLLIKYETLRLSSRHWSLFLMQIKKAWIYTRAILFANLPVELMIWTVPKVI